MSYESAMQRVGELRGLTGADPMPGSTTGSSAAVTPGAFDAQLAQQQALLLGAGSGDEGADSPFAEMGVPVLSVADQYKALGLPMPGGYGGIGGVGGVGLPGSFGGSGAVGQRMVQLAQQEIGVHETSGNNDGTRIREYRTATAGAENSPGPWCAYFVSWLARNAGAPIGANGNGTGYVPTLEAWGKQTNRYQEFGQGQPQPGDIVIFDWGGDGTPDHTGIVESVGTDGTIHTIEGNSSDQVARRTHPRSDAIGFVRTS